MTVKRQETNLSLCFCAAVWFMNAKQTPQCPFLRMILVMMVMRGIRGPNSLQERVSDLSDPTPFPMLPLSRLQQHYCLPTSLFPYSPITAVNFFFEIIIRFLPPAMCLTCLQLSSGRPSAPCPLWLISVWVYACCSKIWSRKRSKQACRHYLRRVATRVVSLSSWYDNHLRYHDIQYYTIIIFIIIIISYNKP